MSSPALPLPFDSLIVYPWTDPVVDAVGHDPRSPYVEHFWLGILGPSTTWLLRRLAAAFDVNPDGFELDLPETAGALGLSATSGRHSPFARTLQRCVQFGLAQPHSRGLAVRRKLPPLSQRQLGRLPMPNGSRSTSTTPTTSSEPGSSPAPSRDCGRALTRATGASDLPASGPASTTGPRAG